jgi:hypothetical protein
MRTPYDTLLRLRQREMDDMRVAITAQATHLDTIEHRHTEVRAAVARAQQTASTDLLLNTQAYMARMRAEREALLRDKAKVGANLARLRADAVEVYGALRVTRSAADDYRAQVERGIANADQSLVDDLTATRSGRGAPRAR